MVKRVAQSQQAIYVAEGGIEWAKAQLQVNSGLRQGSISLATGRAEIVIESSGGGYKVTSKGLAGLAVRRIEANLWLETGKWVMTGYQELHN